MTYWRNPSFECPKYRGYLIYNP